LAKLAEFHEKALNNGVAREGEYFFDRHPGVFHTILDFYRTSEYIVNEATSLLPTAKPWDLVSLVLILY
jgi:hypothetical protein